MTKRALVYIALALGLAGACGQADPSLDPSEASEVELDSREDALRIRNNGGLGTASCPSGGAPVCAACDGGSCVQACYGGFHCNTDSGPVEGGTLEVCSPVGTCLSFSGGLGGFGGFVRM